MWDALPCNLVDEDGCIPLTDIYRTTRRYIQEDHNGIYATEIINVREPARLLTSSHPPKHMLGLLHVRATPRCHPTDTYRC